MAAKLQDLVKALRDDVLKEVTLAGAEVIAEEWRSRVRSVVGRGPGSAHYADAIEARSRAGKNGATAIIGLGDQPTEPGEAQPREYATRLEFNGRPTLRPAFDGSKDRATETMAARLRTLLGLT
jgi:hypothetical protein